MRNHWSTAALGWSYDQGMTKTVENDPRPGQLAALIVELEALGLAHMPARAAHTLLVAAGTGLETGPWQHAVSAVLGGGFQVEGGPYFADAAEAGRMLAAFAADHED